MEGGWCGGTCKLHVPNFDVMSLFYNLKLEIMKGYDIDRINRKKEYIRSTSINKALSQNHKKIENLVLLFSCSDLLQLYKLQI